MDILRKIHAHLRVHGLFGLVAVARQVAFPRPCTAYLAEKHRFDGKVALEVGDISPIFMPSGAFPVYQQLAAIDRLLTHYETAWTATAPKYSTRSHYIGCGTECGPIADNVYDVVLSSHVLEHIANPLKALKAWCRVLKPGGTLALVVPNHAYTFDHQRPLTTFAHLVSDYLDDTPESDRSHVEEFIRLFDYGMTYPEIWNQTELVKRASRSETGVIHHHTFDEILVALSCDWAGLSVQDICTHPPFHIVCVATK